ncbi:MAG: TPM domain-containing protein [Bacteroidota bacterium]|nr:TPM domain-containing protein [Bacteroidota bacterium]
MRRRNIRSIFLMMLVGVFAITIQAQIPAKPNPPRLVNDLAGIFSDEQRQELEQSLVAFNDSTSNEIVIVTVNDLGGYDKMTFAQQIGSKWGVGKAKRNNGIVILLKPKNETRGEAFIATGYGLEGALPDAICKRIVENEMIPYFRRNDYFGGVVSALRVIMPVAQGEYKYKTESPKKGGGSGIGLVVIIFVIIVIVLIKRGNRGNDDFTGRGGGSSGPDLWTMIFLAGMANRNHNGSWGNFSGGGNNDSGGDFGGFGGGDFGGGGAGGSW